MKTYKIEFTEQQLQRLYDVIWAAPVPRSVTDKILEPMENQIAAQKENGQLKTQEQWQDTKEKSKK